MEKEGSTPENVTPFPGNEEKLNQMIDEAQDELTGVLSQEGFLYLRLDQAHEKNDNEGIKEIELKIEETEQEKIILEERLKKLTEQKEKFQK